MLDNQSYKHRTCNTFFFPRRQWINERTSMLHCTQIACLVAFRKLINKRSKTQGYSVTHTISSGVPPRKMHFYSSPPPLNIYTRADYASSKNTPLTLANLNSPVNMRYITLRRSDNESSYAVSTVLYAVFFSKNLSHMVAPVPRHSCLFETPRKSFSLSIFSQFWKVLRMTAVFVLQKKNASRHHQPSTQPVPDICLSAAFLPAEIKRHGQAPFQISARS